MNRPAWALPGKPLVRVTLGDGTTRLGQLLVDRGERLTVEYQTPAGFFQCRDFSRTKVEVLA